MPSKRPRPRLRQSTFELFRGRGPRDPTSPELPHSQQDTLSFGIPVNGVEARFEYRERDGQSMDRIIELELDRIERLNDLFKILTKLHRLLEQNQEVEIAGLLCLLTSSGPVKNHSS